MLLKISLPPSLFIHTLVACPPGLPHDHALSTQTLLPVWLLLLSKVSFVFKRSALQQPAIKHTQRGLETGLIQVCALSNRSCSWA